MKDGVKDADTKKHIYFCSRYHTFGYFCGKKEYWRCPSDKYQYDIYSGGHSTSYTFNRTELVTGAYPNAGSAKLLSQFSSPSQTQLF